MLEEAGGALDHGWIFFGREEGFEAQHPKNVDGLIM